MRNTQLCNPFRQFFFVHSFFFFHFPTRKIISLEFLGWIADSILLFRRHHFRRKYGYIKIFSGIKSEKPQLWHSNGIDGAQLFTVFVVVIFSKEKFVIMSNFWFRSDFWRTQHRYGKFIRLKGTIDARSMVDRNMVNMFNKPIRVCSLNKRITAVCRNISLLRKSKMFGKMINKINYLSFKLYSQINQNHITKCL